MFFGVKKLEAKKFSIPEPSGVPIPEFETRKSSTVVTPVENELESPPIGRLMEPSPAEKEPFQEDISSQEEEEFEIIR